MIYCNTTSFLKKSPERKTKIRVSKKFMFVFLILGNLPVELAKDAVCFFAAVWREPGVIIRRVLFAAGWRERGIVCYHI